MASKYHTLETIFANQSRNIVVEAGYHLVHLLTHKQGLLEDGLVDATEIFRQRLPAEELQHDRSLNGFRSDVSDVINRATREIEKIEHSEITDLSTKRVREYVDFLSNVVQNKSVEELQIDSQRGHILLEELRHTQPT
ncbi:MAG TPA: hypothetical protein VJ183_09570 [Chloroflexia bacterium]|nr:hypothetical protein [Chloroflexia bacterium]